MTPSTPDPDFYTDAQVARMLGLHPVSVRRWRLLNKEAGMVKHGPPYEFRGRNVVYPKPAFREWCAKVEVVDGVPRLNLPVSAMAELDMREPVTAAKPEDTRTLDLFAGVDAALAS